MRLTRLLTDEEIELANDYSAREETKHKRGDYTALGNVSPFDVENKLGQLEDIEERIGCPLEVLLQVFRKGIWVKNDCTKNKIEHWYAQDIKVIDAGCQWDICKIRTTCNKFVGCFNYGKTWALTKEELL